MSENKVDGLEEVVAETTTEKKEKKVQTAKEKETIEAGVAKLNEIGVSEKLALVLALVPVWKGDETEKSAAKEEVIEAFGSSDALKDYIDGDFENDVQAFMGIAKAMPILNNIKSFYARRKSSAGSRKTIQVGIGGIAYIVNQQYLSSLSELPADERKELILSHKDTKKAPAIEEIL